MFIKVSAHFAAGDQDFIVDLPAQQFIAQDFVPDLGAISSHAHPPGTQYLLQLLCGQAVFFPDVEDGRLQFTVADREFQFGNPLFEQFVIDQSFQQRRFKLVQLGGRELMAVLSLRQGLLGFGVKLIGGDRFIVHHGGDSGQGFRRDRSGAQQTEQGQ